MRHLIFFLLTITFLSSCGERQFNDLDEYGLNGPVKSVHYKIYKELDVIDGERIFDDSKIIVTRTLTFDKDGQIMTWDSWYNYDYAPESHASVKYIHQNGRKTKMISNYEGDETEVYFDWENNLEYSFTDTTENGVINYNKAILSPENGRDLGGTNKLWRDGELLVHEDYENELDGNRIVSTTIIDRIENITTKHVITYLKEDSYNNPLEYFVLIQNDDDEQEKYTVREITYYE